MTDTVIAIIIAAGAAVIVCVAVQIILHRRLMAYLRAQNERVVARVDEGLGASAKFLEVQEYCNETTREMQRLISEANKERNRQRVDQIRRMRDRLEAMRARVIDKTVNLIGGEEPRPKKRRRRRRSPNRSRQGPSDGQNKNAKPS